MPEIITHSEPIEHITTSILDESKNGVWSLIANQVVDITDIGDPSVIGERQVVLKYANSVEYGPVVVLNDRDR